MTVSFIIPLYNCLALTQAMLASLRATVPAGFEHEIVLVDDGSTDGTREWLKSLSSPCRVILNERNLGFAATCNRGAAVATGEFLVFLNNDLVLLPRWLEPMLAVFTDRTDAGVVGNIQLNHATGAVDHTGIFFNHKGKPEHETKRPLAARLRGYRRVPAVTGACFAVRRSVWQQLEGFDDGFINGCEDIDFCLRGRDAGLQSYVALGSVVRHHISASTGRKSRDEQNTRRLVRRWHAVITREMVRAWCWNYLATHWEEPRGFPDQRLARTALYHALHLSAKPPFAARVGAQHAVGLELKRWRGMFAESGLG